MQVGFILFLAFYFFFLLFFLAGIFLCQFFYQGFFFLFLFSFFFWKEDFDTTEFDLCAAYVIEMPLFIFCYTGQNMPPGSN